MKKIILVVLMFVALVSCNNNEEELLVERSNVETTNEEIYTLADTLTLSPVVQERGSRIKHRGIYINNFEDDILGQAKEENDLLKWCRENNINQISLYNISNILNDTDKTNRLQWFVMKAHYFFRLKVFFVAASETAVSKIENYQKTVCLWSAKCDGVITEYEFWNNGVNNENYSYYKNNLLLPLSKAKHNRSKKLKHNLYVYRFQDAGGEYSNEEVLTDVVSHLKTNKKSNLVLVYYKNNAQYFPADETSSYYQRYQRLANEAAKQQTKVNVMVLYMLREDVTTSLYSYFATDGMNHDFQTAFENFKEGFENSNIENKKYINLVGYQLYRHSDAEKARPLHSDSGNSNDLL